MPLQRSQLMRHAGGDSRCEDIAAMQELLPSRKQRPSQPSSTHLAVTQEPHGGGTRGSRGGGTGCCGAVG